uniref:Uncharacterized protein n=1 Tax=Cucumis melo TaxID=3656 RepID=A0A9I9EKN3_CUCME
MQSALHLNRQRLAVGCLSFDCPPILLLLSFHVIDDKKESCLEEIGITPALLVRPTVGLMPTTELRVEGHNIDPSVSVPSETVTIFAATDMAEPLLEPHGSPNIIEVGKVTHLALATPSAPTTGKFIGPEIRPLAQARFSEYDCTCHPQLRHHTCITRNNRANGDKDLGELFLRSMSAREAWSKASGFTSMIPFRMGLNLRTCSSYNSHMMIKLPSNQEAWIRKGESFGQPWKLSS